MASDRRITSYSAKLDKLECHYTWFKGHEWTTDWLQKIINKLEADLNLLPQLAVHHLTFLSYLYLKLHQLSESQDIQKALEYMEKAEKKNKEIDSTFLVRSDHVVLSCKLHLSNEEKQIKMEEDLNDLIKYQSSLDDHSRAAISGLKGLAISRLGNPKYEEAIALFKKARELDVTNPNWSYGIALYSGRRSREMEGLQNCIDQDVLDMWDETCTLSNLNQPRYLADYAFVLFESSVSFKNSNKPIWQKKKEESIKYADLSLCKNTQTNDHHVYWQCGRIYKRFGMYEEFEECVKRGVERCTRNHKLYHQLGLHYWKKKGEFHMAREYLQKATEDTLALDFWPHIDLLKLKIEMNDEYDPETDFQRLRGKYCIGDNKVYFEIYLDKEMGMYYLTHGKKDIGLEKLLDAIEKESNNNRHGAVTGYSREIENYLKKFTQDKANFENYTNLAYFYQHVKPEGWVPDSMTKAADCYKEILNKNLGSEEEQEDARINLCKTLCKSKDYQAALEYAEQILKLPEKNRLAAECLLGLNNPKPEQLDSPTQYSRELLQRCFTEGCKDAAFLLWKDFEGSYNDDEKAGQYYTAEIYHTMADMIKIVYSPDSFYIRTVEGKTATEQESTCKNGIEMLLGQGFTGSLRKKRLEMCIAGQNTRTPLSEATDVIRLARFMLDRIHCQFGQHFRDSNTSSKTHSSPHCLFPILKDFPVKTPTSVKDGKKTKKRSQKMAKQSSNKAANNDMNNTTTDDPTSNTTPQELDGASSKDTTEGTTQGTEEEAVPDPETQVKEATAELRNLIESPKKQHGGLQNFAQVDHGRYSPLLSYMTTLQIENHAMLTKLFRLVNVDKHERELEDADYAITDMSEEGDPVGLAHQAATFTEQIVAKYHESMKESVTD